MIMDCRTDKFTFFVSYAEAAFQLKEEERLKFLDVILKYAFYGEMPDMNQDAVSALFLCVKPNIDKSIDNIIQGQKNGRKGGAPKGNQNAKKSASEKTTQGLNENKTDKEEEKDNGEEKGNSHEKRNGQSGSPNIDFEKIYSRC